jgi:hypothetical protein
MAAKSQRFVNPSRIMGEQLTYKNVILGHLEKMSSVLCEKPEVSENGTVIDHRVTSFYYLIRLLHSWLKQFNGDAKYLNNVEKGKFLELYKKFPQMSNTRGNLFFMNTLLEWHDLQGELFPNLDIYPKIQSADPQEMNAFKTGEENEDNQEISGSDDFVVETDSEEDSEEKPVKRKLFGRKVA